MPPVPVSFGSATSQPPVSRQSAAGQPPRTAAYKPVSRLYGVRQYILPVAASPVAGSWLHSGSWAACMRADAEAARLRVVEGRRGLCTCKVLRLGLGRAAAVWAAGASDTLPRAGQMRGNRQEREVKYFTETPENSTMSVPRSSLPYFL